MRLGYMARKRGGWDKGSGARDAAKGKMAGAAGFEPATLGFGDRCSTSLSYAPALKDWHKYSSAPERGMAIDEKLAKVAPVKIGSDRAVGIPLPLGSGGRY